MYPSKSSRRSRSRPLSSSSDSSAFSECSSTTSSSLSGPDIADNVSVFGLSPGDQFNPILEVLPEEQETVPKSPEPYGEVKTRPRDSATECKARRGYSFFGLSLPKSLLPMKRLGDRSVRESWQTTDSQDSTVSDLLDGLGFVLPHPIKEQKFRASLASISTFMTTDSMDAVMPQLPQGSSQQGSFMSSPLISTPLSLSDTDGKHSVTDTFSHPVSSIPECPEGPKSVETLVDDLRLPASPSSTRTGFNGPSPDAFPHPVASIPESPEGPEALETLVNDLHLPASPPTRTGFNCPPSPTYTSSSAAFSTTSTLLPADPICIKAIYDTSIILLRVPRRIGFSEVRQRLYDKFTKQEGIPLSPTYNVVFVSPISPSAHSVTSANRTTVVITLDSDWEQLMTTIQNNKITLRIQDS